VAANHHDRRQLAIVGALVFASSVCTLLFVLRALYTHHLTYAGMLWNLFLAWLPLLGALAAYNLAGRHGRSGWLAIGSCALLWLLFFPNAPYILTDIGNLMTRYPVPLWYDVLLEVAFAWTGTLLGLVSLYLMQSLVRRARGAGAGWVFALAVLLMGSFGVWLGRFLRFNSWDVFVNPVDLLTGVAGYLAHPLDNAQLFVFSGLFALLLISIYLVLVALINFRGGEPSGRSRNVRTADGADSTDSAESGDKLIARSGEQ